MFITEEWSEHCVQTDQFSVKWIKLVPKTYLVVNWRDGSVVKGNPGYSSRGVRLDSQDILIVAQKCQGLQFLWIQSPLWPL